MFSRVRAASSRSRRWSAQRHPASTAAARPLLPHRSIAPSYTSPSTHAAFCSSSYTGTLHRRSFATEASSDSAPVEMHNPLPSKVLIANRGEIACRVIRTCRRLGIRTVAVYSEADAKAAHTLLADEAYCIGPAPSAESYLQMDRIIEVCKRTNAEMVHPGYGFLSENAEFANRLEQNGIKFIGPPSSAIVSMGSKSASKEIMTKAGVPCVPGYHGSDQSDENLQREAEKVGYPILIKAVKGGGGKGMKIVHEPNEFLEQLQSARREAITSFGDGDVLIERYLTKPRHVEVQVVSSGAPYHEHVAISTRDCSVQRRHQKIIEEAPAPHLSPELERDLCDKATAAVRAVDYEGAGTVEFILDADSGEAWFLECNTRLQVEHPVSEMVSGIDLVQWQLEVAAGNPLPLRQEQIEKRGHAFEARIYAEDTRANFLPDVGHLSHVAFPVPTTSLLSPPSSSLLQQEGLASVRVDTGVATGDEVSVYYDPMIAKVIVHGRDRTEALRLMRAALQETQIVGPKTNVDFLTQLCRHRAFIDGSGLETGFIKNYIGDLHPSTETSAFSDRQSAIDAALYLAYTNAESSKDRLEAKSTPWFNSEFDSFRISPTQKPLTAFTIRRRAKRQIAGMAGGNSDATPEETESVAVTVTRVEGSSPGHFQVSVSDEVVGAFDVALSGDGVFLTTQPVVDSDATHADAPHAQRRIKVITRPAAASGPASTLLRVDLFDTAKDVNQHVELDVVAPTWLEEVKGAKVAAKGSVIAPMPSKVVDVRVSVGEHVQEGQIVVVLEAMKTEHTLRAPKAGIVKKITSEKGAMCAEGTELVLFEEEGEATESSS